MIVFELIMLLCTSDVCYEVTTYLSNLNQDSECHEIAEVMIDQILLSGPIETAEWTCGISKLKI